MSDSDENLVIDCDHEYKQKPDNTYEPTPSTSHASKNNIFKERSKIQKSNEVISNESKFYSLKLLS